MTYGYGKRQSPQKQRRIKTQIREQKMSYDEMGDEYGGFYDNEEQDDIDIYEMELAQMKRFCCSFCSAAIASRGATSQPILSPVIA